MGTFILQKNQQMVQGLPIGRLENLEKSKQDTLVSGINIKTVNGNSLVGSGNINITPSSSTFDEIQLNTTRTGDTVKGEIAWNEDKENIVYGIDSDSVEMGISVDMGVNQTGSTITKGMPVCAVGAIGASGKISIAPFIADGSIPNENFLGFAHNDIQDGDTGVYITNFARIRQLNTNAWTAGTKLYPSETTAGNYQTTASATWKTPIAQVINQSSTNGVLVVRYSPGLKTSDLVNDLGFIETNFETVSKNLKSWNATFNYVGGVLSSIAYTDGIDTITKTFNYTGGILTSIVLSGDTPSGIDLTKTLGFTSQDLTSITYS